MLAELEWVMERAVEHHGPDRATRNLRRFYPWYLDRIAAPKALAEAMQRAPTVGDALRCPRRFCAYP